MLRLRKLQYGATPRTLRAQNAEIAARAAEQQANEKLAYMQRVLQEGMMKTQMEAQAAIELQKRDAEHQFQEVRAETELKLQVMSRL